MSVKGLVSSSRFDNLREMYDYWKYGRFFGLSYELPMTPVPHEYELDIVAKDKRALLNFRSSIHLKRDSIQSLFAQNSQLSLQENRLL